MEQKSWRPSNWDKYITLEIIKKSKEHGTIDLGRRALLESGAAAMLEALQKRYGVRITKGTRMVTQPIFEDGDGWLVFIPDEETGEDTA